MLIYDDLPLDYFLIVDQFPYVGFNAFSKTSGHGLPPEVPETIFVTVNWLFADADFAGEHERKSTTGSYMVLVGPNTYFPTNAFSKKQTAITMSPTEAEVIAANHAVRTQGLPSLSPSNHTATCIYYKNGGFPVSHVILPEGNKNKITSLDHSSTGTAAQRSWISQNERLVNLES